MTDDEEKLVDSRGLIDGKVFFSKEHRADEFPVMETIDMYTPEGVTWAVNVMNRLSDDNARLRALIKKVHGSECPWCDSYRTDQYSNRVHKETCEAVNQDGSVK